MTATPMLDALKARDANLAAEVLSAAAKTGATLDDVEHLISVVRASERGAERAREMVPGVVFRGAIPEAIDAGYECGSSEYKVYIHSFVDALPRPIRCGQDGVIAA